mgnify:FL=1|jgi:hypothetical protein|nr:MAG TPA: hypothetical protein [Caudoviricetes sp.]
MAKNKLVDLNDHLFAELERLGDEDLKGDELKEELDRAKALSDVSEKIINNASLMLKAIHEQNEYGTVSRDVPKMLLGVTQNEENLESRKR